MKHRLQGILIGVVLTGTAVFALPRLTYHEPLSSEQRHVLAEHGFTPMVLKETITIELPGEPGKPYPVKELVKVNVPPAYVEPEIVYRDRPETDCPEWEVGPVEIGGGCEVRIVGDMAQGLWDCQVAGSDWKASRGPLVATEVRFEASKEGQVSRWKRHWFAGPIKARDGWGGAVGISGQGHKWLAQVQVGAVPYDDESLVLSDGEPIGFSTTTTYEPLFQVSLGRRW